MKFVFLGLYVSLFVVTPFCFLNSMVMPELHNLERSYADQNQTVQAIVAQPQP